MPACNHKIGVKNSTMEFLQPVGFDNNYEPTKAKIFMSHWVCKTCGDWTIIEGKKVK